MRYIYPDHTDIDEGPTVISDEAEALVDGMASSFMRGNNDYAYIRAQNFWHKAFEAGVEKARKEMRDYEEEENRRAAEYGHGKAEFRTLDGGKFNDKLHLSSDSYYPHVWKRACRLKDRDILSAECQMNTPIQIRTYEFRGERTQRGLPVYEEMGP